MAADSARQQFNIIIYIFFTSCLNMFTDEFFIVHLRIEGMMHHNQLNPNAIQILSNGEKKNPTIPRIFDTLLVFIFKFLKICRGSGGVN